MSENACHAEPAEFSEVEISGGVQFGMDSEDAPGQRELQHCRRPAVITMFRRPTP